MQTISIKTRIRSELIDITSRVQKVVSDAGLNDGCCLIFSPHTTAGLTLNENADPAVREDIKDFFNRLVPKPGFTHSEGNSDSHIKSSLFGPSLVVAVEEGRLQLGQWQAVYLCESDGPRTREVWVKTLGQV